MTGREMALAGLLALVALAGAALNLRIQIARIQVARVDVDVETAVETRIGEDDPAARRAEELLADLRPGDVAAEYLTGARASGMED